MAGNSILYKCTLFCPALVPRGDCNLLTLINPSKLTDPTTNNPEWGIKMKEKVKVIFNRDACKH